MAELKELETKMKAVMAQAKECVDLSLEIVMEKTDEKKYIYKYWESFVVHLFEYVKMKEKKTGQDIIKGIPMKKLLKLL